MCACVCVWPSCLDRESAAARLLGLRVRIPPGRRMSISCECCVLPGRGLRDGPITRPEKSYQLWACPCVRSRNLKNGAALSRLGLFCHIVHTYIHTHILYNTTVWFSESHHSFHAKKWRQTPVSIVMIVCTLWVTRWRWSNGWVPGWTTSA